MLTACYNRMQSHLKIHLILTISFIKFCIENHEVSGSLTQKCLQLYRDKGTLSTFSVISVNKYVVIITQNEQQHGKFKFWSAKVCICTSTLPDISIKSAFPELGKEFPPTISLFFRKMTAKVSRNNCAKWHQD